MLDDVRSFELVLRVFFFFCFVLMTSIQKQSKQTKTSFIVVRDHLLSAIGKNISSDSFAKISSYVIFKWLEWETVPSREHRTNQQPTKAIIAGGEKHRKKVQLYVSSSLPVSWVWNITCAFFFRLSSPQIIHFSHKNKRKIYKKKSSKTKQPTKQQPTQYSRINNNIIKLIRKCVCSSVCVCVWLFVSVSVVVYLIFFVSAIVTLLSLLLPLIDIIACD